MKFNDLLCYEFCVTHCRLASRGWCCSCFCDGGATGAAAAATVPATVASPPAHGVAGRPTGTAPVNSECVGEQQGLVGFLGLVQTPHCDA